VVTRALAPAGALVPALMLALVAFGCASSATPPAPTPPPPADETARFETPALVRKTHPTLEIAGVSADEQAWSPDGDHLAYARPPSGSGPGWRVLVRNVAGTEVREFDVYRPGAPDDLGWIDESRLAYLAPAEKRELDRIYVVHDARTGEILAVRRGRQFSWSAGKRRLAYVNGPPPRQRVVVDGVPVWPRGGASTTIHGQVTWSPAGEGLALIESNQKGDGKLVVLLELDNPTGDLTWRLPAEAMAPGLHLYWAGESQVVIGETNLAPKFAANWKRVQ